jgi:hypothetical protein
MLPEQIDRPSSTHSVGLAARIEHARCGKPTGA